MTINAPLENTTPPWNPPPVPWHAGLDGFPPPDEPPEPPPDRLTLTSIDPTTGPEGTIILDLYGTGFIDQWVDNATPFMQVTYDGPLGDGYLCGTSYTLVDSTHIMVPDWTAAPPGDFSIYIQSLDANDNGGALLDESDKIGFTVTP